MSWFTAPSGGPNTATSFIRVKEASGASADASLDMTAADHVGKVAVIYGYAYQTCSGVTLTITYSDDAGADKTFTLTPASDAYDGSVNLAFPIRAASTTNGFKITAAGKAGSKIALIYYLVSEKAVGE